MLGSDTIEIVSRCPRMVRRQMFDSRALRISAQSRTGFKDYDEVERIR